MLSLTKGEQLRLKAAAAAAKLQRSALNSSLLLGEGELQRLQRKEVLLRLEHLFLLT